MFCDNCGAGAMWHHGRHTLFLAGVPPRLDTKKHGGHTACTCTHAEWRQNSRHVTNINNRQQQQQQRATTTTKLIWSQIFGNMLFREIEIHSLRLLNYVKTWPRHGY